MPSDSLQKLYYGLLFAAGLCALLCSIAAFPFRTFDSGLLLLSMITIFASSPLRIQLLRTKIYFTISDTLIFLTILWYAGSVAVILAVLESGFASWTMKRRGITVRPGTAVVNMMTAGTTVFVSILVLTYLFGPISDAARGGAGRYFGVLIVAGVTQFTVNSLLVAVYVALTSGTELLTVWKKYCLGAVMMFVGGAVLAGVAARSLQHLDLVLFVVVLSSFGVLYSVYRSYAEDAGRLPLEAV